MAPADLLGFLLHGMPLKYALAATAASQQYLYQAPLAVRRDRNDSKSGLASPNFYLLDLAKFLSFIHNFLFESSLTSGNYLTFPRIPTKICENLGDKITDFSENSASICQDPEN